jgi:hypothetical protein
MRDDAAFAPSVGRLHRVLRFTKRLTNEIDGFVRQARRKQQRYQVVSRGFATTHGERSLEFMSMFWWNAVLMVGGLSPVGNTGFAANGHQSFCLSVQGRLIDLLRLRRPLKGALS